MKHKILKIVFVVIMLAICVFASYKLAAFISSVYVIALTILIAVWSIVMLFVIFFIAVYLLIND